MFDLEKGFRNIIYILYISGMSKYESKFMDKVKAVLTDKGLATGTINMYMTKLVKMNGNKPFASLSFLKEFKKMKEFLEKMENHNTRKSYITAVVSVLNNIGTNKEYKQINIMYKSLLEGEKIKIMALDPHEKTEAQKENWMDWTDVMKLQKEMEDKVKDYTKEDMTIPSKKKAMFDYLLLSLYALTPPRRNLDYLLLKLDTDDKKEVEDVNYYNQRQKTFTFNVFKTKWKNGKEVIPCPLPLCRVLDKYISFMDVEDNDFILFRGDATRQGAMITKALNRIFKKKIGASMLRHSYDTHKYGAVLKEMKHDAMMMSHSVEEQKNYVKYD
jgi:hypothetical protein